MDIYFHLWVLLVFLAIEHANCQKIILHKYRQSDSVTQCRHALVEGTDVAVFTARVDFTDAPTYWARNVVFEVAANMEEYIYEVSLKHACSGDILADVCNCDSREGDIFLISCRFPASVALSKAKIRGKLSHLSGVKYSVTRDFPEIFDLSSITVQINEDRISAGQCSFKIKESSPAIRLHCDKCPDPCNVTVYSHGNLLLTGETLVIGPVTYEDRYTVEYKVCGRVHDVVCLVSTALACKISRVMLEFILVVWLFYPGRLAFSSCESLN